MKIQVIAVGKLKGGFAYLVPGLDEYLKRLKPYADVSVIETPDEPIRPTKTAAQIMEGEAERIWPYFNRAAYRIALSERGKCYTSEAFSAALHARLDGNPSNGGARYGDGTPIIFIVGGPLGLSDKLIQEADWVLSLSTMTFPHPMVRLILLEQLYRAFRIARNEPYHK